jgi:hypothetical protein
MDALGIERGVIEAPAQSQMPQAPGQIPQGMPNDAVLPENVALPPDMPMDKDS